MKELVEWLQSVEGLARALYAEAATQCSEDPVFSTFLRRLADDEGQHFDMMERAKQLLADPGEVPTLAIAADEQTRHRIERPIHQCFEKLRQGKATRKDIIEAMVQVEFSELNDIFTYVLRVCRASSMVFQEMAAIVQEHRESIERFVAQVEGAEDAFRELQKLPRVWTNRYLVADDDPPLRELFTALFEDEAEVVVATNGEEALQAAQETFFNVIVSDIEMPRVNGLEFFRRVTQECPSLAKRFLFWSGSLSPEVLALCREYEVPYLQKPVDISTLRQTVKSVRGRTT